MKFYEENDVLGKKISQEIQEEKKFYRFKTALDGLVKVDNFIIGLWKKIYNLF